MRSRPRPVFRPADETIRALLPRPVFTSGDETIRALGSYVQWSSDNVYVIFSFECFLRKVRPVGP